MKKTSSLTAAARRCAALAAGVTVAAVATAAAPAHAAGRVAVDFVDAERYADTAFGGVERGRKLAILRSHFERLGARLPDGQTLRVDVLDVDLAGTIEQRGVHEVRVLRGGADWPRIALRYTLLDGDRVVDRGDVRLADMDYLDRPGISPSRELGYEMRMLDDWFAQTFATAAPARVR